MKKIFLVFLLFSSTISHTINIKYIKGTYEVLKPEYRHLSPVHGAIWWEKSLAQKYYKFGFYGKSIPKTKKGIARPPYGTVALIRDLFHEVQGSFNVTKSPASTAFHFSPETVAKILAKIEEYKGKQIGNLAADLRKVIASDTDFQTSVKKYFPNLKSPTYKMFARNVIPLTNAIVASLQECGFVKSQENPSYPKETTHSVLLSFLYRKSENKSEFKNYFDELANALKKPVLTEQGTKQVSAQQWITDAFNDSKKGIDHVLTEIKKIAEANKTLDEILQKISLDKIVFGEISRSQALPHIAQYTDIFFEKVKFPDCAETTIRNLSNIVTYNAKDNTFDIDKFKNADPKIRKFYTTYSNAAELEEQKVHQAWVPIIENKPFIAYHTIVAQNNPKKIAKAPTGTEGFIYGFKDEDIKKLKPQAINIYFDDDSSDALQKVKINDGEYIIIDPKQYYAFEVRPSLRNTIILMNQFFGLSLYQDLNSEFFKKNFNTTYFPQLVKKFGWQYQEYKYSDLDTNDYANKLGLEIELTTENGGKFLLSFKSAAHGYVQTISTREIEEYEIKILKQAYNASMKNQSQVTADLLCIYYVSILRGPGFVDQYKDFAQKKLTYLFNYFCYLDNLNEPNTAIDLIGGLIQLKNSILFNLAAALFVSLPIQQDLHYQSKVIDAIIQTKTYQNGIIKNALDNVIDKIMAREIYDRVLGGFVDNIWPIYQNNLLSMAEQNIQSKSINNQNNGLILFEVLVIKGLAFEQALKAALALVKNSATENSAIRLLMTLVEKEPGIENKKLAQEIMKNALTVAQEGMQQKGKSKDDYQSTQRMALRLFYFLLKNKIENKDFEQQIINSAIHAVQEGINNRMAIEELVEVTTKLVDEKGKIFDAAIQVAQNARKAYTLENADLGKVLRMLGRLIKKGKGYKESIEIALSLFNDAYKALKQDGYIPNAFLLNVSISLLNEIATKNKNIVLQYSSQLLAIATKFEQLEITDIGLKLTVRGLVSSLKELSNKKSEQKE